MIKNETEGISQEVSGVLHVYYLSSFLSLTLCLSCSCWHAIDEFSQGRCKAGKQVSLALSIPVVIMCCVFFSYAQLYHRHNERTWLISVNILTFWRCPLQSRKIQFSFWQSMNQFSFEQLTLGSLRRSKLKATRG